MIATFVAPAVPFPELHLPERTNTHLHSTVPKVGDHVANQNHGVDLRLWPLLAIQRCCADRSGHHRAGTFLPSLAHGPARFSGFVGLSLRVGRNKLTFRSPVSSM